MADKEVKDQKKEKNEDKPKADTKPAWRGEEKNRVKSLIKTRMDVCK